ncbi:TPR-like protein [Corynespora cassiicola Philippines]|uniref:TPR-like protein n=1 Tax=Corynespora cassiicola Philippines TaxID=1448308 RepID=A0A2T2NG98_CORCC|nr:TPR-like protein [Corynespora cassiicola Philippines]
MSQSNRRFNLGNSSSSFQAGNVENSHVTNNFYPQPYNSQLRLKPSLVIPYPRGTDFVERGTLLQDLNTRCAVPASRIALVGLGGVGKSRIAIEYCYRVAETLPSRWVFWVHGSNLARLEQSYRHIANRVKLRGREDSKANIFELMFNWLDDDSNGKWLLVFDNIDDTAIFPQKSRNPQLSIYVPVRDHGSIILTSRNRDIAQRLIGEPQNIIGIEPMNSTDAVTLLRGIVGENKDQDNLEQLAAALEFMPLAIIQARAFLNQHRSRYTLQGYLEKFNKNNKGKTALLRHDGGDNQRDDDASSSILITWQISFEHILTTRPSAADLLSLMSLFDRQGIPQDLLQNGVNEDFGSDFEDSVPDEFEDDILMLENFSFITTSPNSTTTSPNGSTTFDMHALVQLATQKWLERKELLEHWKSVFISNMLAKFPKKDYEGWDRIRIYFPHVKSALMHLPAEPASRKEWFYLMTLAARYSARSANHDDVISILDFLIPIGTELFGQHDRNVLATIALRAEAIAFKGGHTLAEDIMKSLVGMQQEINGPDHPQTQFMVDRLAGIYLVTGNPVAEDLLTQILKTREDIYGQDHPQVWNTRVNLASSYERRRNFKESELMYKAVVISKIKKIGVNNLDTIFDMDSLGRIWFLQGRYKEARLILQLTSAAFRQKLGPESNFTLSSNSYLAQASIKQGRCKEALTLAEGLVETCAQIHGPDSKKTARSTVLVANIYTMTGYFRKAEQLLGETIRISKKILKYADQSIDVIQQKQECCIWFQGRYQEAEELESQALVLREINNPEGIAALSARAMEMTRFHRWDEARSLLIRVIILHANWKKEPTFDLLINMGKLAMLYKYQGQYWKAISAMKKFLQLGGKMFGCMHPDLFNFHLLFDDWYEEFSAIKLSLAPL